MIEKVSKFRTVIYTLLIGVVLFAPVSTVFAGIQLAIAGCGIQGIAEIGQPFNKSETDRLGLIIIQGRDKEVEQIVITEKSSGKVATERLIKLGDSLEQVIYAYGKGDVKKGRSTAGLKKFQILYSEIGILFDFEIMEGMPTMTAKTTKISILQQKRGLSWKSSCPWDKEMQIAPNF